MKQGRRAQKFISPHWWRTSVIWLMPNWRQTTKNTKVELYSEAILWRMILDLMQYSQNKDHQHHKWRQERSWISYPDCQGAQDKQLIQYLLVPGQNGGCSQIIDNSRIGMSRHFGFVYHDTNGPNHGPVWKIQSFPLERNLYGHPLAGLMGKAIWENSIEIRLGEGFQVWMLNRTPWKRIILICVCGWHQIGWKETKHKSDVESTQ